MPQTWTLFVYYIRAWQFWITFTVSVITCCAFCTDVIPVFVKQCCWLLKKSFCLDLLLFFACFFLFDSAKDGCAWSWSCVMSFVRSWVVISLFQREQGLKSSDWLLQKLLRVWGCLFHTFKHFSPLCLSFSVCLSVSILPPLLHSLPLSPKGKWVMSDVSLLSAISGLSFESPFLYILLCVCVYA